MKNNLTKNEIMNILKNELPYLNSNYGVRRIALFGSFTQEKKKEKENSDIDIMVEFEKPIGLKFIDFAEYVENLFGRKIDILTPEGIKGIRIKKIAENIKKGLIYV